MAKSKDSEFRAYPWISSRLATKGWNTRNPNRSVEGQVYTQNECLQNPELKAALGAKRPENVVIVAPNQFWLIEAKAKHSDIGKALDEAKGYADDVRLRRPLSTAPLATGVAGNDEDGFIVRSALYDGLEWKDITLKGAKLNRFLSADEVKFLISKREPDLQRPDLPVAEVVAVSHFINRRLHIAKVAKEQRAKIVALLLLALAEDPGLRHRGNAKVFLSDINSRAEGVFSGAGKTALWNIVKIDAGVDNFEELARELNQIVNKLHETDIVHAAKSDDILGIFFESFLKYGNTSKELGIVLTPRQICWLASEALAVGDGDYVYDPAVGSGGFLISALNRVKREKGDAAAIKFAKNNLFAAEDAGYVAALAFINMHFRGDGKHNIYLGSCFKTKLRSSSKGAKLPKFENFTVLGEADEQDDADRRRITRVLMNPPFALKDDDQKETDFVDHGLAQVVDGGFVFALLPASVLYEKKSKTWREMLLERHTVKAVISLPYDVFYPVATESVCIILQGHIPHAKKQVLWLRIDDDGFLKRKGYRVERPGVHYSDVLQSSADALRSWIHMSAKATEVPGKLEYHKIKSAELIPHAHLGTGNLDSDDYKRAVVELYRGLATQHWDQGND